MNIPNKSCHTIFASSSSNAFSCFFLASDPLFGMAYPK
jgi:hypothetical protein